MMEPQTDNGTFEATRTILAPMPVLGIPEVLVDEARGLWSVRAAGAEQPPSIDAPISAPARSLRSRATSSLSRRVSCAR